MNNRDGIQGPDGGRIVLFAAEQVGMACLEALVNSGADVVGVVTAHDDLKTSVADWVSFDGYANAQNIDLQKVKNCRGPELVEIVSAWHPNVICILSWSMIVPESILELPHRGTVGIHYSLLPDRRGGAPLNWALIDGLTESGITLYYLDEGVDTGDIIDNRRYAITDQDSVRTLLDRIISLAPKLLLANIQGILDGTAPRTKQDESKANVTKRRRPEDGLIDWSLPDRDLYNFIRALGPPYPCAFTYVGEKKLTVTGGELVDGKLTIQGYVG